jgi:hypothetical protein
MKRASEDAALENFIYKIHQTLNTAMFSASDINSNDSPWAGANHQRLADVAAVRCHAEKENRPIRSSGERCWLEIQWHTKLSGEPIDRDVL